MIELGKGSKREDERDDFQQLHAILPIVIRISLKAKTACEVSDRTVSDHFVDVNKMIQ
ncbi:MAG: hypothetical protein WBQ23_11390 [Bacteroidota bacterium]